MNSDGQGTVVLSVTNAAWPAAIDHLEERAARIVKATLERSTKARWLQRGEVSLLLSDDAEICELNSRYRERNQPTNVLSFPNLDLENGEAFVPPPPGPVLLGDIAMSFERLSAEARERNKSILDHFAHLLVHGTLHLVGYDHREEEQALVMERIEEVVLSGLGMAAPYDVGEDAGALGALS